MRPSLYFLNIVLIAAVMWLKDWYYTVAMSMLLCLSIGDAIAEAIKDRK